MMTVAMRQDLLSIRKQKKDLGGNGVLTPEEGGTTILRNPVNYSSKDTASHLGKL